MGTTRIMKQNENNKLKNKATIEASTINYVWFEMMKSIHNKCITWRMHI